MEFFTSMVFVNNAVAAPRELSGNGTDDHNINARKGEALSGAFIWRAVDVPGLIITAQK